MSYKQVTSTEAVNAAISEFKDLGREAFLSKYRFGKALEWFVEVGNDHFDSKAIYGVAHGLETGRFLVPADFSGGEAGVGRSLRKLGFKVVKLGSSTVPDQRNPTWTRDELILALDTYILWKGNPPSKNSDVINDLSTVLNTLNRAIGTKGSNTLRNANGVYMKMMNYRRFDPLYADRGLSGLTRGGNLEEEVWNDFNGIPDHLHRVANAIKDGLAATPKAEVEAGNLADLAEAMEAVEGRLLTAMHVRRERSGKLIKAKKAAALKVHGSLRCEACQFDFEARYGERGVGFVECHHTRPLATLEEGTRTKLSDLALLCANCHRMIHARRQWLTVVELIAMLR